jgi:hypothetical protein
LDCSCRSDGVFVFPDSDDFPASIVKTTICIGVASLVSLDLGNPEVGILLSGSVMFWAAVPEAPVKEDRDLSPCKYDICRATDLWNWTQAYPITHTQGVHGRAQREFRLGVAAFISPHHIADRAGRRPGPWSRLREHWAIDRRWT